MSKIDCECSHLLANGAPAVRVRGESNYVLAVDDLALSVSVSSDLMGFAPYGRLTFFACAKKVSKETHPCIRPRLRRGSLAPSPLQGHATKGRPWPIVALATSMSLNPFHGDFTRPPEGGLGVVFEIAPQEQNPNTTDFDLPEMSQARDLVPFRRPSGGVAQGGSRMDAAKGLMGQGWPM